MAQFDNLVSICIPSFNGMEKLRFGLPKIIGICRKFNFQLCVFDNGSDDGSTEFIQDQFKGLDVSHRYRRSDTTVDFRQSFENAIKLGKYKYHWLMGNDDLPIEKNVPSLLSVLSDSTADVLLVNAGGSFGARVKKLQSIEDVKMETLFSEIGNYATWMSSFLVSHSLASDCAFSKYKSIFPHTEWLYDCLAHKGIKLGFIDGEFIEQSAVCSCSYNDKSIDYFTSEYYGLIAPYRDRLGKRIVKLFLQSNYRTTMSLKTLLRLRAQRVLTLKALRKNRMAIGFFPWGFKLSLLVVMIPPFLLTPFLAVYYRMK